MQKILLVEDERALSNALSLKLRSEGFEVTQAFNGQEALDELKKSKYDLMILDLVMPVLDGYGVLEKLRADKNKQKVLILSNLSQEEDITKTKELKALDFLIKSNSSLIEIVTKIKSYFK